ncbi:MAG: site-specific integrase [Oscillospiraceae bacterium]|jgi:integrase|nr:site-specific integrase [Oscillospiraceae bacterium]
MSKKGLNIRKRKDGRWEARYIEAYDFSGKAIYKSIYGAKYSEVKKKKLKMERSILINDSQNTFSDTHTVEYAIDSFLASVKPKIKESTYARYVFVCEKHIIPYFKACRINRLNYEIINEFIKIKLEKGSLKNTPLSSKTVNDIICILIQAIKKPYKISFDIDIPSIKLPKVSVLSEKDYNKLLSYLFIGTDIKKLGLIIAMLTGMRLGELCALQWEDIDLNNEVIRVTKTMQRVNVTDKNDSRKTKIIIDTPKSETSTRLVPVPSILSDKLRELNSDNGAYVLTGNAKYAEPRNYQTYFKKMLNECNLQDSNFHMLRHTFATRAVAKGMDVKTLSEILGHADVSFTLKMYIHPSLEQKKEQIEKIAVDF